MEINIFFIDLRGSKEEMVNKCLAVISLDLFRELSPFYLTIVMKISARILPFCEGHKIFLISSQMLNSLIKPLLIITFYCSPFL